MTAPGDGGPGERGEVGRDVQEGAAHVQALAARPARARRRNQVHHHPRERHDEHEPAPNLRRRDEPADGGVDDQHAHDESVIPFTCAARISSRRKPNVHRPRAGRPA